MKKYLMTELILISILGLIVSCKTPSQKNSNENIANTQDQIHEKYDRFDLTQYENIKLTEKYDLMEKVKEFYPQYSEQEKWPDEFTEPFHFIDLDSDGDKDLIFDGWSGGEPMMVQIALNIGSEFKIKFTDYIDLVDITFDKGLLTELAIHDPGCCLAIMEHDIKYKFSTSKDSIGYWIVEYIEYHNETQKPDKYFNNPIAFEVQNTPYTLRITPSIDTSEYYYPDDSKGNILQTYSEGDKGIAIAEKNDETGRIWWYVIMDSKDSVDTKINHRDNLEPKLKGWMSSRFLRKE